MKLRLAGAAALLVMLRAALVCAQDQADAGVETPDAAPAPAPVAPAPAVAAPAPTAVAPAPPANVPFMAPPPPPGAEVEPRAPDGTAPVKPYTHH
ncbi:MAG TPA: hypothetical protein VGP93_12615, partial [Polyangiaceae bacterium]|nr:hypothetical protein [Polyangiaceae bacterium]